MSRIGRGLLAKPKPKPKPVEPSPPPRAKSAETRKRMSEGQLRRNAITDPLPVRTSAQVADAQARFRERQENVAAADAVRAQVLAELNAAPRPVVPRDFITARPPRITPPPLPPVPPRPELDLVKGLEALPLPIVPAPVPSAPTTGTSRGSCRAINPDTGRQCALLKGHTKAHRHGSTEFFRTAEPGQTSFRRRELLDAAATAQGAPMIDAKSNTQEKRESRERLESGVRLRDRGPTQSLNATPTEESHV